MSSKEEKQVALDIEQYLRKEKEIAEEHKNDPKILILGTSDSGKSTLIKQLKLLHGGGFTKDEVYYYTGQVYRNLYLIIYTLLNYTTSHSNDNSASSLPPLNNVHETWNAAPIPEDEVVNTQRQTYATLLEFCSLHIHTSDALFAKDGVLPHPEGEMRASILKFFEEEPTKKLLAEKGTEIGLQDTTQYFMNNLERHLEPNFKASNEDILQIRTITIGIHDHTFPYKTGKIMHFYDVAGQKQYRKQWMAYFSDVHTILFIASLSCFDQMMAEDLETNRMTDALKVFENIVNHPMLKKPDMILFLNKRDLFEEKIKKNQGSISKFFPGFNPGTQGGNKANRRYELGISYFRAKFLEQVIRKKGDQHYKTVTVHTTCCTDTNAMKKIMADVINAVTKAILSDAGML